MPGVSRLMYMNDVQVVDFAVCRFGHSNKGPMRMLSLQVAQKVNRRCPNHRQHPTRETYVQTQDRSGLAAVLCKAIFAGTEDTIREYQDKTIAYSKRMNATMKKVGAVRREEMTYFEAMGVYKKSTVRACN